MQRLTGTFEEAPEVTEAPTEGWGDHIAGALTKFMGGEETATATAAPPDEAPAEPDVLQPPGVGAIEDGYRFKGGDPSDPNNWEPVG